MARRKSTKFQHPHNFSKHSAMKHVDGTQLGHDPQIPTQSDSPMLNPQAMPNAGIPQQVGMSSDGQELT